MMNRIYNINTKELSLILVAFICFSCGSKKQLFTITNDYVEVKYKDADDSVLKASEKDNTPPLVLTERDKNYFSKVLDTPLKVFNNEKETNHALYLYIKKWLGTPYLYGGDDKNGIDCSAFVQQLCANVYKRNLGRTCDEMVFDKTNVTIFKDPKGLKEGDLVFFRKGEERIISHVGIYLKNGKFLSATTTQGVSIADLNKPFWKKTYLISGRLRGLY